MVISASWSCYAFAGTTIRTGDFSRFAALGGRMTATLATDRP
jgi:hypothetical protein